MPIGNKYKVDSASLYFSGHFNTTILTQLYLILTQRWRFVVSHRPYEGLKLRAGFHTGDVIAGVQVSKHFVHTLFRFPNILSTFFVQVSNILSTSILWLWHFFVLILLCPVSQDLCVVFSSSYICWNQDCLLTFLLINLTQFTHFSSVLGSRFSTIHIFLQCVGIKMPRYRLFGETAKFAALLNSTGEGASDHV